MFCKIKNEFGCISIASDVAARIAGLAAMDCYGIVGMAAKNVKDGIVQLLKKESLSKGVIFTSGENGVKIDLHIMVEYGTNIIAICESLIGTVKYNVEESIGLPIEKINIFVEGIHVDN